MQKSLFSAHLKTKTNLAHTVLLGTTALVLSAGLALAQDLPTSSTFSQTGTGQSRTNTLTATTTGQQFFLNTADPTASVQDATGGSNSLSINVANTVSADSTANYVFVSQLGNTISTITLDGAANMIYLRSFGGTAAQTTQTIDITGDGNTVDAATNAISGAADYGFFDIDIQGNDIVVNVTNDEFSDIYLAAIGSGDTITVTQDNEGELASGTAYSQINVNVRSSAAFGAGLNNTVLIEQLGINNILDFDLVGDENAFTINQRNDTDGINDLTVDVADSASTVTVSAFGAGTNVFRVGGSGSDITVDSDTGTEAGFSAVNATSALDIFGNDNIVVAEDFSDVSIRIGTVNSIEDNGFNEVRTSGNADVALFGMRNYVDFTNSYDEVSLNPAITFGGEDNRFTISNLSTLNGTNAGYRVDVMGSGNTSTTNGGTSFVTTDVRNVTAMLVGNDNDLSGAITNFSDLVINATGDANILHLNGTGNGGETLNLEIVGDANTITTAGGGALTYYLDYIGSGNTFDYTFGAASLVHDVYGSDFAGSVFSQGSGYTSSFTEIGTGFVKTASNGSVLIVASGCTYGFDCAGSL